MRRFFAGIGVLLVACSLGLNVWLWHERPRVAAELQRFGLVREDTVLAATLDTLRRERVFGDSLRSATARLERIASVARTTYAEKERELLATVESAREALGAHRIPVPVVEIAPSTETQSQSAALVLVDSAKLVGALRSCRESIAADSVALASCALRADSSDARAARAERGIVRADSARKAAVDSAGTVIAAAGRRALLRDVKAGAIGAGSVAILTLILQAFSIIH